jgi:hypothetical protein
MPVDSSTTSTPRSAHGRSAGSFDHDRVAARLDRAVIRAVRRVVLEQQRVHLGVDEVVDRDDLDVRRPLDDRLE